MHGTTHVALKAKNTERVVEKALRKADIKADSKRALKIVRITPDMATEMLERNRLNRPLRQHHVKEIAKQITEGRWKFNGDSIKIDIDGNVADGQHRLWAIFESGRAVDSVIVYGVERDAFSTMDTNRIARNGGDIIALSGTTRHRNIIASALSWQLRHQSGSIVNYRASENKITNDRIEQAFAAHPEMARAVERVGGLRRLCNISLIAFFYYILANRDQALADRMVDVLEEPPAGISLSDPFLRLRQYFLAEHEKSKDPVMSIALAIKAANAAHASRRIDRLYWRSHGRGAEPFPKLEV